MAAKFATTTSQSLVFFAGSYHVFYERGDEQDEYYSALLSIFVGALGIVEVTALINFLVVLKGKVGSTAVIRGAMDPVLSGTTSKLEIGVLSYYGGPTTS